MIISAIDNANMFVLRWRDDKNKRLESKVSYADFNPYFYILANDTERSGVSITEYVNGRRDSFRINLSYTVDGSVSLDGRALKKVTWSPPKPAYTRELRKQWRETFEADVPFHYRYAIDQLTSLPEYKLRKFYWDLEWQQRGEHDGAITCISYYDNYSKKSSVLWWQPDSIKRTARGHSKPFDSEKNMLLSFIRDISEKDPDMLIAWFGSKFDLPKLIERLHANDIDPRLLSPYNDVKGVYYSGGVKLSKAVKSYTPIEQPIRGRLILNLDLAFERQWNDAQRGTLPSLALDYVSENVLGEKKLVSSRFPDKNEFFQRGWLEDTQNYLDYARKDVDLLVRLDEENYTSEAIISLQRLIVAPFDACFYASNMGGIYFMRNATWKAPTGDKEGERIEYEGAMIYNPETERTNGLHLGVAAFDFAGLYPSMMIARNISWETKSKEPTEFGVNVLIPRDFSPVKFEDWKYYRTDELGLLPKAVLDLKKLRTEYKKRMYNAKDPSEYAKWNNNQLAVKRLMASFYGVVGYQGFGWADVDLAASITASAREAIREAAFKVMEL
jgi:DNA polymerase elongation subunit (family B)